MRKILVTVRKLQQNRRVRRAVYPFLLLMLMTSNTAQALTNPLIDMHQVSSSDISAFTKWTSLMPRYAQERAGIGNRCADPKCLNLKWERLLTRLHSLPPREQVKRVNQFFNRVPYLSDQKNYGVSDYWATPYEFMARGGDCEDYAVAKYISLRRLGFSENQLRIVVVHDWHLGGTIHAVLEVKLAGETDILDNQEKRVLPEAKVMHYAPVFAINEATWWSYQ